MNLNFRRTALLVGICSAVSLTYTPQLFAASVDAIDAVQQAKKITGTVTDAMGPVIGANVLEKGTTNGVITDIDGRYTISAPANRYPQLLLCGMKDKEEKVNGRTTINIIMETDSKMIDEVVVIGYGTQRRGSVTGAVSAVKGQDMIKTKNENPQNMLTGRIPVCVYGRRALNPELQQQFRCSRYGCSIDYHRWNSPEHGRIPAFECNGY